MENILRFGPKKITLNEVTRDRKDVVKMEYNVMPISEASINRMLDHGKNGMIIISSNRSEIDSSNPELSLRDEFEKYINTKFGSINIIDSDALYDIEKDWLKNRNARADRELKDDIQKMGYSYTPVYGGYHGQDDVSDSFEPSYVVYNYKRGNKEPGDFQELKQFAIMACDKFKQDSVYVQEPGKAPNFLDCHGNKVNSDSSLNFKINDPNQEFFTTTKREKSFPQRFTSDIVFENCYIPLRPADYNEKRRRLSIGEYIL